jgi:dienelactone hydrolase
VLTAAKLYAHLDGIAGSQCYQMMWGSGEGSLSRASEFDHAKVIAGGKAVDAAPLTGIRGVPTGKGAEAANAAAAFDDCSVDAEVKHGLFDPVAFRADLWEGSHFHVLRPVTPPPQGRQFPLLVFMHGLTGQYEMYEENLRLIVSHGFVVVFPFVKNPEADKSPLTTNTDGTYILKAVRFAAAKNANATDELHGVIDLSRVVVAGHSMGATCSIMATRRWSEAFEGEAVAGVGAQPVVTIAQHPGICGPFGPPPWPSTWMPADMAHNVQVAKVPLLFTTATNDAAFWPAPHTAEHELGCFTKALGGQEVNDSYAAFGQFSSTACSEDGARKPFPDGGHNCPLKAQIGGQPETRWVLTAAKLYAHLDGIAGSQCYQMMWGSGEGSLSRASEFDHAKVIAGGKAIHAAPLTGIRGGESIVESAIVV